MCERAASALRYFALASRSGRMRAPLSFTVRSHDIQVGAASSRSSPGRRRLSPGLSPGQTASGPATSRTAALSARLSPDLAVAIRVLFSGSIEPSFHQARANRLAYGRGANALWDYLLSWSVMTSNNRWNGP